MMFYLTPCLLFAVVRATEIFVEAGSGEVTCAEHGHLYVLGERMPITDPCQDHCWCSVNARKACSLVTCEYPACFDPIHDNKEDCCPRCPNGANCKMDDLVLLQGQSVIQKVAYRCSNICTCIYGGQEPTCVLQCDDVPPLALLDKSRPRLKTRRPWKPIRRQAHKKRNFLRLLLT